MEAAGRLLLLPARPAVYLRMSCLLYLRVSLAAVPPWVTGCCPSVGHPCCDRYATCCTPWELAHLR